MSRSDAPAEPAVFNPGDRLDAFVITERGEGKKPFWTKIGAAWVNRDGSIGVTLEALPVGGKLHLRLPRQDDGQPSE